MSSLPCGRGNVPVARHVLRPSNSPAGHFTFSIARRKVKSTQMIPHV